MTGLYTVYLFVKQLNKNKNTFRLMSNLTLAPQYRKRLLQISTISMRNINNHVKVEKINATCNNKRWFGKNIHVLWGLKHGMGG